MKNVASTNRLTSGRTDDESGGESGFMLVDTLVCILLFSLMVPLVVGVLILVGGLNTTALIDQETEAAINSKASALQSTQFSSLAPGTYSFSGELTSGIPSPRSASYTITTRAGSCPW